MKKIFFVFAAFLTAQLAFAQGGIEFKHSWKEALSTAAKEKKLIFMDAYTTWCGPCKKLTKEVFPNEMVGAFFNENFINLKMDMEKGEGLELAEKFDVNVYPTLLFVNAYGEVVHRTAGFHTADQLIDLGSKALDPSRSLASMEQRFNAGNRDADFLAEYAIARFEAMDNSHQPIAEAYLKTQNDWSSEVNRKFIFRMVQNTESPMFDYLVKNRKSFETIFGEREVSGRVEELIYGSIYSLGEMPDLQKVDAIFQKAYPEKAEMLSARYRIRHYLEQEDVDGFAKATAHYLKKFPSKDPQELNELAWTFYEIVEDKKMLKKAVKWANKSVKLENAYYNNDTVAALYYKLGKKSKGIKAAEKAIALAKVNNEDSEATQELLNNLKKL